jgi:amino acid transporter
MAFETRQVATHSGESSRFFSRRSSGLVREIGLASNVAITLTFMAPPVAVLAVTVLPSSLPGADPLWSHVLAAAFAILPALLWSYFLVIMPRSGGDYVFVSRALHPSIGFIANFSFCCWLVIAGGLLAGLTAPFALSPAFATLGAILDSNTLLAMATDVTTQGWQFAIGAGIILVAAALLMVPVRTMLVVAKGVAALVVLGLLACLIILATHDRASFEQAIQGFGASYSGIISAAHEVGYPGGSDFSLHQTLVGVPVAFATYGYCFLGVYTGSELRSPQRDGRRAIFVSLGLIAVIGIAVTGLAVRTFGLEFLGSSAYLSNAGSPDYPLPAPAFFFFYVSMLVPWAPLDAFINLTFVLGWLAVVVPSLLVASRSLFAWSSDQIVPAKLSEISPRTGTPVLASVLLAAIAMAFLALAVFGESSLLGLLFSAAMGQTITFIVLGLAGIAFPYTRRALFDASPIGRRVAGLPLMSVIALAATGVWGFIFMCYATVDGLGANTTLAWRYVVGILLAGTVIYVGAHVVNKARGVDPALAHRELPPD